MSTRGPSTTKEEYAALLLPYINDGLRRLSDRVVHLFEDVIREGLSDLVHDAHLALRNSMDCGGRTYSAPDWPEPDHEVHRVPQDVSLVGGAASTAAAARLASELEAAWEAEGLAQEVLDLSDAFDLTDGSQEEDVGAAWCGAAGGPPGCGEECEGHQHSVPRQEVVAAASWPFSAGRLSGGGGSGGEAPRGTWEQLPSMRGDAASSSARIGAAGGEPGCGASAGGTEAGEEEDDFDEEDIEDQEEEEEREEDEEPEEHEDEEEGDEEEPEGEQEAEVDKLELLMALRPQPCFGVVAEPCPPAFGQAGAEWETGGAAPPSPHRSHASSSASSQRAPAHAEGSEAAERQDELRCPTTGSTASSEAGGYTSGWAQTSCSEQVLVGGERGGASWGAGEPQLTGESEEAFDREDEAEKEEACWSESTNAEVSTVAPAAQQTSEGTVGTDGAGEAPRTASHDDEDTAGDTAGEEDEAPGHNTETDAAGADDEAEVALKPCQGDSAVEVKGKVQSRSGTYSIFGHHKASDKTEAKIKDALEIVDDAFLATEWGTVPHRVWLVVGGRETCGPLVRREWDLTSPLSSGHLSRLAPGTLVKQLKLVGQRLFFQRLSGTGPATGWVSTRAGGKQLLVRLFRVRSQVPTVASMSPADDGQPSVESEVGAAQPAQKAASCQAECDIVPMGHYCLTALLLKKYGWRHQALPLDWCAATFRVWLHMLGDDFKTLLSAPTGRPGDSHPYNKMFFPDAAMFLHQGGWANQDVRRRVTRLRSILAQRSALGLAVYMDGSENCSQTLEEVVDDGRRLLELERGFSHLILVWIESGTSNPPKSEWKGSSMSSRRMSLLRYTPSRTVNYYSSLSQTDSECLSSLLSERFPENFKRNAHSLPEDVTLETILPGKQRPHANASKREDKEPPTDGGDGCEDADGQESVASSENDAIKHWNDRFDESVYWEEVGRRQNEQKCQKDRKPPSSTAQAKPPPPPPPAPRPAQRSAPKRINAGSVRACGKHITVPPAASKKGAAGAAGPGKASPDDPKKDKSWASECQKCHRTEGLVLDPIKEGHCHLWDGKIYCSSCWGMWTHSDQTSPGAAVFRSNWSRQIMRKA